MKDPRALCLVSAKIRNLTDFYQRILSNQQPPSGLDIVNTLRYFQQTLLGYEKVSFRGSSSYISSTLSFYSLLKDVQGAPVDTFVCLKTGEQHRTNLFPNLSYSGLYFALNNIIDVYPQVTSGQIGKALHF